MHNRRKVTEEDLLITEALIAKSYGRLKHSVVQAPSRAFGSLGRTAREHPYATAGTAIVAGVVLYKIIQKMTSHDSVQEARGNQKGHPQHDAGHSSLMHMLVPLILPLAAPYVLGYVQNYLGSMQTQKRG